MPRSLPKLVQPVIVTYSLICVFSTSLLAAHPFHTSVAELDWNAQSGRWEVSVRIHAGDLELALAKHCGQACDIDSPRATQQIKQYIESRFQLLTHTLVERLTVDVDGSSLTTQPKVDASEMEWVGQEVEGGWMWLYFELSPPKLDQPLALVSQLLTEINEDQINIVSIRNSTKKRSTLQTSRKQLWIAL